MICYLVQLRPFLNEKKSESSQKKSSDKSSRRRAKDINSDSISQLDESSHLGDNEHGSSVYRRRHRHLRGVIITMEGISIGKEMFITLVLILVD